MHLALRTLLCLFCALSPVSLCAQPLQSEANDPNSPPYANVRPQDTEQLRAGVREMHQLLRELQQSDLNPAQKQAALDQLIRDHHDILRMHNTWLDWQQPQTVDSASLLLEKMIFEVAAEDIAPDAQSREQVLHDAPQHLELDPEQQAAEHYEPPLLTPVSPVKPAGDGEQSHAQETVPSAMSAAEPAPPPTDKPGDDKPRELAIDKNTKVAVLADDKSTAHMHEDSTVLRQVTDDKGDLLLFGDIRLWIGGAIQLDAYSGDGLYTLDQDGDSDSKSYIRRGEGILRASVLQNAEIKVQYDFDTREFRSLYWRWLSQSTSRSLTLGNQKEPIGQDYLVGSKFTTAMEPSAPSSAFGSYRSTGIRYNGWHWLRSAAISARTNGAASSGTVKDNIQCRIFIRGILSRLY